MERRTHHSVDYDSSALYSGKPVDRIFDEPEREGKRAKADKKIDPPMETAVTAPVDKPLPQPEIIRRPAIVEGMVYLYDPDGKRLMSFKAKITPGMPNSSRRGSLIGLLTSQENPWRITDKNQWKAFRQSEGYQQANSRDVFNELLQKGNANS